MCPGQSFSRPHVLHNAGPSFSFLNFRGPNCGAYSPPCNWSDHSSKNAMSLISWTLTRRTSSGEKYMKRTSEASRLLFDAEKSNGVLKSMAADVGGL